LEIVSFNTFWIPWILQGFRIHGIQPLLKCIYVDVQGMICTGVNQSCPIFTPNGKLITFDGIHLTKHGALYVGRLIFNNEPLNRIK